MKRNYPISKSILTGAVLLTLLYSLTLGAQHDLRAAAAATPTKTKVPLTLTSAAPTPTKTKVPPTVTPAAPTPSANSPLYIGVNNGKSLYDGDIWAWTVTQLSKRTSNGHNQIPVVAPGADWLAYLQVPPAYVTINPDHDYTISPTDVYLFNVKSGQATQIASQPKTIINDITNHLFRYTLRSQPSWSPDGKALAWTEIVTDGPNNVNADMQDEQLVIYDLATKQRRTVVEHLPAHRSVGGGGPLISNVSWGPSGLLAVLNFSSEDIDPNDTDAVVVYDQQGKLISTAPAVTTVDVTYDSTELIWLTTSNYPMLSCVSCSTQIDPLTGTLLNLPGTPEVFSKLAPNKLSMYFGADSGTEANVTWVVALNGVQVSKFDSVRLAKLSDLGISPDGMQVAVANFAGQGTTAGVFIYRAKTPDRPPIPVTLNITGMGWGPLAWRIHPDPAQYF